MTFTENFQNAINDYQYLLDKKYPQKAIIKIICDRYSLSSVERTILFRGIAPQKIAINRQKKIIDIEDVKNNTLYVDAYNVLITISSYLFGNVVFVGNDNFLRDASEIHGKAFRDNFFQKSIGLIIDYLKILKPKKTIFYLDNPVSLSGELSSFLNEVLAKNNISGSAETVHSPDYHLINLNKGICATSDSVVIDKSGVKIFDLARNTLVFHFKPAFLSLL
ncbi:MAG: DUF434 domain-containing protein [Bacteroidales bacterium]|nr:DUF434 domain-containing protein [Bacteroidales bacterium]